MNRYPSGAEPTARTASLQGSGLTPTRLTLLARFTIAHLDTLEEALVKHAQQTATRQHRQRRMLLTVAPTARMGVVLNAEHDRMVRAQRPCPTLMRLTHRAWLDPTIAEPSIRRLEILELLALLGQ